MWIANHNSYFVQERGLSIYFFAVGLGNISSSRHPAAAKYVKEHTKGKEGHEETLHKTHTEVDKLDSE